MDVAQLMEMVEQRKGDKSYEAFAREIGLNSTTLFKMIADTKQNPNRDLGVSSVKTMIASFWARKDYEMVRALIEYATGLDADTLGNLLSPSK